MVEIMKILTRSLLAFFVVLALGTNQLKAEPGEVHFGVDAGLTWADILAEEHAQELANLSGQTVSVEYDEATWAGRLYGDYGIAENMNIELGWTITGSLDAKYTIGADTASESYKMSLFDASLKYGLADSPWFVKGGMHHSTVNGAAELTIGGTTYNWADSITGTGWLAGGGMEVGSNRYGATYIANVGGDSDSNTFFAYYGWRF